MAKKIIIIVVCLIVTIFIILKTSIKEDTGINSIASDETIWVKCVNPDCGAEYQMNLREYLLQTKGNAANPMSSSPAECKECSERSLWKAEKCSNCGTVFIPGTLANDLPDRCPSCGFSERENRMNKK